MKRQERPGITVVEVLVCVACAGLLLGQAIPAARRARGDAQQIECMSKVGQIARAGLVYAALDPAESSIPLGVADVIQQEVAFSAYSFGGKSGVYTGQPTWNDLRRSYFSGLYRMDAHSRPLNDLLYKDYPEVDPTVPLLYRDWTRDARLDFDVYHCPGDTGFPGLHHAGWKMAGISSYNFYGTSFATNPLFVKTAGSAALYSNSPYHRALSSIPNPQKTLLYMENAARYALYAPNPEELDQTGCFWGIGFYQTVSSQNMVAHGHHGDDWHFNTASADGHASYTFIKGHGRVPSAPGLPEFCGPPGSDGAACECLYVRGLDWQMDTLPAAPVETSKVAETESAGGASAPGSGYFAVVK